MELHYFLTTNGSGGQSSFLSEALLLQPGLTKTEGLPRSLFESTIEPIYLRAKESNTDMHIIHNCLDNSIEGIYFPQKQAGLVNRPLFSSNTNEVNPIFSDYKSAIKKAYQSFKKALNIHDAWEKIYIGATDYACLDAFSKKLIQALLKEEKTEHEGSMCHRFFGSATILGSVDYVQNLSYGLKRYFIKGRPGTGKSTFLKKLARAAQERGFHVECYHCSFDPKSLDMVAVRELSFCIFDSTAPHEYFPTKPEDEIIDFYAAAVQSGTDETYKEELLTISKAYKTHIKEAVKHLNEANTALETAEHSAQNQWDEERLRKIQYNLLQKL